MNFIEQRLQFMSKMLGEEFTIKFTDKIGEGAQSEGTRVDLTMPVMEIK